MATSTFQGPVRSLNGFYTQGPGTVVNITSSTTLDVATHAGKVIRVNNATATITLPQIVATADANGTGPGSDPNTLNNVGVTFEIFIETTASAMKIKTYTSDGTDKFVGTLTTSLSAGAGTTYVPNGSSNDVINLNGTTTGGIAGSVIYATVLASGKYLIQGQLIGSGTLATPFADS